ncbi:YceH family protein [Mucilaginibacter sp.]|uniref:YceH family protein n=1 Tax=Mucilaginibacter sp. TaxID=1882438 RepID=UPI00262CBF0E|nr:YceH family protein [Mucilaginibacter sp.]MDB5031665.1 hypothetical protein [Mucilaginibacter sp.]
MDTPQTLPILDAAELRVLGSLMEKCKTTPDYYPMTLNGLTAACNQKTSRKPVVQYEEAIVMDALSTLKKRGLISTATGGSIRSVKYKHNFAIVYPLIPSELAVLCLLMLRGALTPGELNTNSGRLYEFESIEEVQDVLDKLAGGDMPYLMQLPKRPGQKEARYAHLLAGVPDINEDDDMDELPVRPGGGIEARLSKVELELAELKEAFDKLMKELS